MPFIPFHRPTLIKNTPLLNALTTKGAREADQFAQEAADASVATSSVSNPFIRYASRVAFLRRMANQSADADRVRTLPPSSERASGSQDVDVDGDLTQAVNETPGGDCLQTPAASVQASASPAPSAVNDVENLAFGRKTELIQRYGEIATIGMTQASSKVQASMRISSLSPPVRSNEERTELLLQLEESTNAGVISDQTYLAYANALRTLPYRVDREEALEFMTDFLRRSNTVGVDSQERLEQYRSLMSREFEARQRIAQATDRRSCTVAAQAFYQASQEFRGHISRITTPEN